MIRPLCLAAVVLAAASVAHAQSTPSDPEPQAGVVFLPNYHFHLNAAHLSSDDPRYVWDTNFGGELGIIGYRTAQLTFVANYQAMLGEEFHPFDPNQGNYTLAGVLGMKVGRVEVAGQFHHVSRHLADRPKRPPVDWNMLGGRVATHGARGPAVFDARVDLRSAILRTYVDYTWEVDAVASGRYRLIPSVELIAGGEFRRLGVNGTRDRGTQTGGRGEGGLRFNGRSGAIELYLAVERRIDPYQLEFGTDTWGSVGMRLLSK